MACFHVQLNEVLTYFTATREWISLVAFLTEAYWNMIRDLAEGIDSTSTWTWVNTLLIDTSPIVQTVLMNSTLRVTLRRTAVVLR